MGLFDRVSRLLKSNANAAIDKLQDRSKEVDQLIEEMESELRKARRETQRGMAAEKIAAGRIAEAERKVAEWGRRAEDAARAGDDALAREALERQRDAEQDLELARQEHREAAATAQAQQEALRNLDARLREVKHKKGTIKAKLAYGKNQDLSTDALDEFERMAGKVDEAEGTADAERELAETLEGDQSSADAAVRAKLARIDRLAGSDVDERLAALKKKLDT